MPSTSFHVFRQESSVAIEEIQEEFLSRHKELEMDQDVLGPSSRTAHTWPIVMCAAPVSSGGVVPHHRCAVSVSTNRLAAQASIVGTSSAAHHPHAHGNEPPVVAPTRALTKPQSSSRDSPRNRGKHMCKTEPGRAHNARPSALPEGEKAAREKCHA